MAGHAGLEASKNAVPDRSGITPANNDGDLNPCDSYPFTSLSCCSQAVRGWSAFLVKNLRRADVCIAVLGIVLALALLAYMLTGRNEKGAWVRFGLVWRGDDDLRGFHLDGDRPSRARGNFLQGVRQMGHATRRL